VVSVLDSGTEEPGVQIAATVLSGSSPRQTVYTHRACVHQAVKLVAAYRRVYDSCHLQADCQEPGSAPEPYARQLSMGYLYVLLFHHSRQVTV